MAKLIEKGGVQELLRPLQVEDAKNTIGDLEENLKQPEIQDKGAIQRAINNLKENLHDNAPRSYSSDDIDRAIEQLIGREREADSLVSLGVVQLEHPSITKRMEGDFVAPYIDGLTPVTRRQQLQEAFFPYGVIYLSKRETLLETGTFYQKRTLSYRIERWQNYEVDDACDWVCVEAVLRQARGV